MTAAQVQIKPQPGFQQRFVETKADIAWGGGAAGAGKSFALLLWFLLYAYLPNIGGVFFRRTMPQIKSEGGLWDTSESLFMSLPRAVQPKPNTVSANWTFPNGNRLSFSHLQHEKNKFDWQGTQIGVLGIDELTHFTESMYWYLISRLRSSSDFRAVVRCTMNPQGEGWVKDFLVSGGFVYPDDYEIEELAGFPVQSMAGKIRWFLRYKGEIVWGNTKSEVAYKIPESERHLYNSDDIKSFTFIPGKLDDNQILIETNPSYRGNLLAQSEEDQAQLLGGRWVNINSDKLKLIDTAALRDAFTNDFVAQGEMFLTADIAMEGSDLFVVKIWSGWCCIAVYTYDKTDGAAVVRNIEKLASKYRVPGRNIAYDSQGVGNYLKGYLKTAIAVSGSASPIPVKDQKQNFLNLRSQLYFHLADKIHDCEVYYDIDMKGEHGKAIYKELNAIHKKESGKDQKLAIEAKDGIKLKLGGKSPDYADCSSLRSIFDLIHRPTARRGSSAG